MKDVAVLLLAGGVGSRLNILVARRAKPAVPFGGIYRIIDFTLSNIANSGLTNVAVLTQYKPLSLMDHIGDGSSWDLSGRFRRLKILPPKTGEKEWDWYKGTADAVRQNLQYIMASDYRYVLIVSGDHVYHMDYGSIIRFHQERSARVTIAMVRVPWEETHQFGTAVVDEHFRIVEWEEKIARAKSNLASMGIYVFDRDYLAGLLETTKEEDFGYHIIPKALQEGHVFGYPFSEYWRDVGTLQAYWEANMDLLRADSGFDPESWKVMTNLGAGGLSYDRPPIRVAQGGRIVNSIVSPGCKIFGKVEDSVLSPGVVVEEGALVNNSIVMHDSILREGTYVERCILDKQVLIGKNCHIGMEPSTRPNGQFPDHLNSGLTIVGKEARIPDFTVIGTNCIIHSKVEPEDFPGLCLGNGESLEKKEEL